jgi:cell surface protein SprA
LDLLDAGGRASPDNVFDFRRGITIIPETGEIIFPMLEPFGRNLPDQIPHSQYNFDEVYDTTQNSARNIKSKDKWILMGKSTGEATSTYQLGFNVVEGSVRVLLNGRELIPGIDYSVDYNIGQLTIRNDAALVPGADLRITFEQNDLFQLASKTLLGARGIIDFSQKTRLGFSILNLNQQTLSDKVRIGEEPLSNSIYGVDFSTSADLPFLTRALDNIISTKQMSTLSFSGEYAYVDPDPNTKKSTIASDQGKSIAYIDDFEGAKRIIPVGISYVGWKDLSPPGRLSLLTGISDTLSLQQLMDYKAKAWWYTITPGDVNVNDIWPNRQAGKQDQAVTVMDFVFLPDTPGTYNCNPENLIHENYSHNWGGIMKLLSSTANNLVDENIEFIEFWANIRTAPQDAKIYIDLGNISEQVIPFTLGNEINGVHTEDRNENDAIDEGEDTGLDGMLDDEERAFWNSTRADPCGDNFFFNASGSLNPFDYFHINGTEGNALLTDIGRIPDTEDLNRNGSLDRLNSYFRYEIPLDTSITSNPFIAGGGDNAGWYLYRIPIKENSDIIGDPSFTNIEMIRLFVTGVEEMVHLRITEFNLVGSQWQKIDQEDTVLSISVINLEDNPEYTLPPGVFQERDRSRPDEDILRNEQSLNLIINGLPDGQSREAVKFLYRPLDVFNYTEMKLFVHGEPNTMPGSVSYISNGKYAAEVFFRFGSDSNNYYEYRQPVLPGWNEISIPFDQLTAIKQSRGDSINVVFRVEVPNRPGHFYQLKGNPTLTSIKFLSVGIHNVPETPPSTTLDLIYGQVWINELRVIGADDSPGWAYSFQTSMRFADLLGVSFNMSRTNPYFHKLADRFGSRIESTNWGVATDLDVLKLLPINLPESNLKINYSHNESLGKPLYIPGTDIRVEEAASQLSETDPDSIDFGPKTSEELVNETQTLNISDTWSASGVKLKVPTSLWYIRDTFNALTFGFNYNKTFSRSPTVLSNRAWVWNANSTYGLSLSPDYHFEPVDIPVLGSALALFSDYKGVKVYYVPQTFSANLSAKRNRNTNITRARQTTPGGQVTPSQEIVSRDFTSARGFAFNWKVTENGLINLTTNYSVNINATLAYLETDSVGGRILQRRESDIWNDIFSGEFFGRDYSFQQSVDFRTSPRLPTLWDINRYFTLTAGYSVNYQWNFDLRSEEAGRSAGFSSKTTFGLTLRLKALTDPLFTSADDNKQQRTQTTTDPRRTTDLRQTTDPRRTKQPDEQMTQKTVVDSLMLNDTLTVKDTILVDSPDKPSSLKNALLALRSVARAILFEYETITINFGSDNSLSKSGIKGQGTGFNNFWGFAHNDENGPTRTFMLGLGRDVGERVTIPGTNLSDVFSHKNNIDIKTAKPLWTGAKIDLSWKVGWSINRNTTLRVDENGDLAVANIVSTGSLNRSFLSVPPILFFSFLDNGITKVNELYTASGDLSSAFIEGFETLPLLSKLGFLSDVTKYIPRPNWRITWDGLEKIFIFKEIANRVSLDHSYTSSYTEGWRMNPEGQQEIQTQRIEYGFAPLAGLNFTFGELWGGNLISSIKYSVRTNYDLGITTNNINETFSRDIGITAGYSKSGFDLPLFGVSLKNDIEFSFSYTSTRNSTIRYEMNNFIEEGIPQDGTIRTTLEPRIKYTISAKVTLSIFYKRSSVEPEGAARIPPTTTNEAGLDVHISIQ